MLVTGTRDLNKALRKAVGVIDLAGTGPYATNVEASATSLTSMLADCHYNMQQKYIFDHISQCITANCEPSIKSDEPTLINIRQEPIHNAIDPFVAHWPPFNSLRAAIEKIKRNPKVPAEDAPLGSDKTTTAENVERPSQFIPGKEQPLPHREDTTALCSTSTEITNAVSRWYRGIKAFVVPMVSLDDVQVPLYEAYHHTTLYDALGTPVSSFSIMNGGIYYTRR